MTTSKKIKIKNMVKSKQQLEEEAINIIDRLLEKQAITGSEAVTLIHAITDEQEQNQTPYTPNYPIITWGNDELNKAFPFKPKPGEIYCQGAGTGDYHGFYSTVTC